MMLVHPPQFPPPVVPGAEYYRFRRDGAGQPVLATLSGRPPKDVKRNGATFEDIVKADRTGFSGIAACKGNGDIEGWEYPWDAAPRSAKAGPAQSEPATQPTNKASATCLPADSEPAPVGAAMVSGFGQFHTNEVDPTNPGKKRTAYTGIDMAGIRALVDSPQQADKAQARWLIPSTLPTRDFKRQEQVGSFWLLWADLDKEPQPIKRVAEVIDSITDGCDFEVYASRSATVDRPKARVLIPLAQPLRGADWVVCQEVLNDSLDADGLITDRASERAAQLCYLPNRGEYYDSASQRDGVVFDPLTSWASHIAAKRRAIEQQETTSKARKAEAEARRSALASERGTGGKSLIEAFNECYTVQEILVMAGYAQRGNSFRHPASESGSFSATVKDGRVHSLSSSDLLYTGGSGGGAHDAFSAFSVLWHQGDEKSSLNDAGEHWLAIGGESWNKVQRREYAQRKSAEELAKVDLTAMLKPDGSVNTGQHAEVQPPTLPTPNLPTPDWIAALQQQNPAAKFEFVPAGDLVREPQPVEYLVDEFIEHPSLMMLFGAPSAGKSFVAISMAASVATGHPWLGRDVRQGTVFYLAGEGHAGLSRRLRAWEIDTGVSLEGTPLFVSKLPAQLMDSENAKMVEAAINGLSATHGLPVLIVIDTLARNMGSGDESSNADIGKFVAHIDGMRHRLGCTVQLVHHSGHLETERARGASALPAAMDASFQMEDKGGQRSLTQKKSKESELAAPIPLTLKEVPIGWRDAKGREICSAVIVQAEGQTDVTPKSKTLTARQQEGLQSLCKAIVDQGAMAKKDGAWLGCHVESWRTEFYRTCTADDKKKAFQRVRDDLKNRGLVRIEFETCYVGLSEPALIAQNLTAKMQAAGHGT